MLRYVSYPEVYGPCLLGTERIELCGISVVDQVNDYVILSNLFLDMGQRVVCTL